MHTRRTPAGSVGRLQRSRMGAFFCCRLLDVVLVLVLVAVAAVVLVVAVSMAAGKLLQNCSGIA